MSAFSKYIQDTRVELKHVAWPTQMQTIVYTILVVSISVAVALYIGFFDFFFTRGLEEFLSTGSAPAITDITDTAPTTAPDFNIIPGSEATGGMPVITNEPVEAPKTQK